MIRNNGNGSYRHCPKTPNIKKCDAPNCDALASTTLPNNYCSIYQIIDEVKKNIYLPSVIFDIIFSQLFMEINAGGNGLCIIHNKIYDDCGGCVFSNIPKCKTCTFLDYGYVIRIMKCCNRSVNHHHKPLNTCRFSRKHLPIDYGVDYVDGIPCGSIDWCIDFCHQFGTWCDICNNCIGHPHLYSYYDKYNTTNYPHCLLCGTHSGYPHCLTCGKHSKCDCNPKHKNDKIAKKLYCSIKHCRSNSQFPHCVSCELHH